MIGFGAVDNILADLGDLTKRALEEGAIYGRGGRGSLYMSPGGNSGRGKNTCSYEGYINSIYTIGINAISQSGRKPKFGERCPGIMAAAYSGGIYPDPNIVTTDVSH